MVLTNLFSLDIAPFLLIIKALRLLVIKGMPPDIGIQASTLPSATP
jgi:hypothetical protein